MCRPVFNRTVYKLDLDSMEFWKGHHESTALKEVATKYLLITRSLGAIEKVFSSTGYTINERRSCLSGLSGYNVNMITFYLLLEQ